MKQAVLRSLDKNLIFLLSLLSLTGCRSASKQDLGAGFVLIKGEGSPDGLGSLQRRACAYDNAVRSAKQQFTSKYESSNFMRYKSEETFNSAVMAKVDWDKADKATVVLKVNISDLQNQVGGHKLAE